MQKKLYYGVAKCGGWIGKNRVENQTIVLPKCVRASGWSAKHSTRPFPSQRIRPDYIESPLKISKLSRTLVVQSFYYYPKKFRAYGKSSRYFFFFLLEWRAFSLHEAFIKYDFNILVKSRGRKEYRESAST